MATTKMNKPPSPSLAQLQSSLSSLATAAHILDGFAHRNKNQHRATKWWGPFDMLRRSLHKTLPDLEAAVQRAEVLSSSSTAAGSKRKRAASGGAGGAARQAKQPEQDRVAERATWMRDVVGSRAYEAFTQLAADRQFAQLGLVLIGVLAQVEAAIAPLVRENAPEPATEEAALQRPADAAHDADSRGKSVPRDTVAPPAGAEFGGPDLGVAVSRTDLESGGVCGVDHRRDGIRPSVEHAPSPAPQLPPAKKECASQDKKKRKNQTVKEAPSRIEKGTVSQTKPAELKEAKKAKKRKKKGGDEFDDLFSSLL